MEPEGSLVCSQETITGPYPESDGSSSYPLIILRPILILPCYLYISLPICVMGSVCRNVNKFIPYYTSSNPKTEYYPQKRSWDHQVPQKPSEFSVTYEGICTYNVYMKFRINLHQGGPVAEISIWVFLYQANAKIVQKFQLIEIKPTHGSPPPQSYLTKLCSSPWIQKIKILQYLPQASISNHPNIFTFIMPLSQGRAGEVCQPSNDATPLLSLPAPK
jgi:hypothetical protein